MKVIFLIIVIALSYAVRLDNKSVKVKHSQNIIQAHVQLKNDVVNTSQNVLKLIPELNDVIKNDSILAEIKKPFKVELISEVKEKNKIDILPEVTILSKQNVELIIAEVAELDRFIFDRDMMLAEIDFMVDPKFKIADIEKAKHTQDNKDSNQLNSTNNQDDNNSNYKVYPYQKDDSNTEQIKIEKFIYNSIIEILKEEPSKRNNSKKLSNKIDIIVRQIVNIKQREQIRNLIFNIIKDTPPQGWKEESLKKLISDRNRSIK
jgi:hypothetical protein